MAGRETLVRYADLKIQEKDIKAELERLNEEVTREVLQFIDNHEGTLPKLDGKGIFSVMKKKTWTYTTPTQQAEAALKLTKKDEEATGAASFEEREVLIFLQDK